MNSKFSSKCFILFLSIVFVFFMLVFKIQISTPLQSDDYSYFFNGGSLEKTYNHYMTWSGRLSADITSSTLLYFFSKKLYSILNSTAFVALAFFISWLPANISNRKLNFNDALTLVIVFLTYWVANTNLGQTTFWIVGSANYLWTNLFLLIYFNLFFLLIKSNVKSYFFSLCLFVSGLIAGCTNENIGIFSFLFSIFVWILCDIENKKNKLMFFLMGSISTLLGWLILILSPGNLIRANHPSFSNWYSQTIFWRSDDHLFTRLPNIMSNYWQVFIIIIFTLIAFNLSERNTKQKNNNTAKVTVFFFFSSIASALLMLGAPAIPLRSGNGTLVLLLIVFSLISSTQSKNELKINFYIHLLSISFLLIYFIPSYYLVYKAYDNTHNQEIVRENIIKLAKGKGEKNILIPDFIFSRLIKDNDRFDFYHNAPVMGKYWGVDEVNIYQVPFNYGVIAERGRALNVDKKLTNDIILSRIFIYNEPVKPFFKNEAHLTVELNLNPENLPKDKRIYIHLSGRGINNKGSEFVKQYGFINADIGRSKGYLIGDKYYVDRVLPEKITVNDVDNVDAGIF